MTGRTLMDDMELTEMSRAALTVSNCPFARMVVRLVSEYRLLEREGNLEAMRNGRRIEAKRERTLLEALTDDATMRQYPCEKCGTLTQRHRPGCTVYKQAEEAE